VLNSLPQDLFERATYRDFPIPKRVVSFQTRLSPAARTGFHTLSRFLLVAVVAGMCTAPAFGGNRINCSYNGSRPGASGGGKLQLNGFTIEVKPVPDPNIPAELLPFSKGPEYTTCHASVRSPKGKLIFERNDWNIGIDPITGRDLNGDAEPDVVLVGFSGGAYCCWTYSIISLGNMPGLIREFEDHSPATFKDLKADGQIEILTRDATFEDGFGLDHAFSPHPLLIFRLNGETFEDVSAQFWQIFDKDIQIYRSRLNKQDLQEFLLSNPYDSHDDVGYLTIKTSVLMVVLDYLYADQPKQAQKALSEMWPPASKMRTWKEILNGYCSGFRSELGLQANSPCQEK
jgi:hypothetical protein